MSECLLCEKKLTSKPSWRSLLTLERKTLICLGCRVLFKPTNTVMEEIGLGSVNSIYSYNEAMRNYLHQFKFLQDVVLADVFQDELHTALKSKINIIPIPMHAKKKVARTFAHVEELLKSANVSYDDILEKIDEQSMGEKSKEERLAMAPLFKIKSNVIIRNENYTLVDDIYTTGTTLRHAALLLMEAGAKKVEVVTLIRATLKEEN